MMNLESLLKVALHRVVRKGSNFGRLRKYSLSETPLLYASGAKMGLRLPMLPTAIFSNAIAINPVESRLCTCFHQLKFLFLTLLIDPLKCVTLYVTPSHRC